MNENNRTVCIKFNSGDEIFAELIHDEETENRNLIKLYQPYQVKVFRADEKGTKMMLSPWQLFTDDLIFFVQADHITCINTLDNHHKQVYGSMVVNSELKNIQNELAHVVKTGTITSADIDDALKATYMVLMKSGIKYSLPLPEKDKVKTDFYTFLMGQYEDKTEVTH